MSLTTRVRAADPLAGRLPDALNPPTVPSGPDTGDRPAPRRLGHPRRTGAAAALALACVLTAALAVALPGSSPSDRQVVEAYMVSSVSGDKAWPALVTQTVEVLHRRLAAADTEDRAVRATGPGRIDISCAGCAAPADAAPRLSFVQRGHLLIYDWEANVVDARCRTRPANARVTGGPAAGQPGAGSMSYYDAVVLAGSCPARAFELAPRETPGFYAVDPARERVLTGLEPSELQALTAARAADRDAGERRPPIVRVPVGTTVVMADHGREPPRDPNEAEWFVLRDNPALTDRHVAGGRPSADRASGAPTVTIDLTADGRERWTSMTRRIADRGQADGPAATPNLEGAHHVAIALDGRLLSVPFVDPDRNPHGIDPSRGVLIAGGLTPADARTLAALLDSGVLPSRLSPVTRVE